MNCDSVIADCRLFERLTYVFLNQNVTYSNVYLQILLATKPIKPLFVRNAVMWKKITTNTAYVLIITFLQRMNLWGKSALQILPIVITSISRCVCICVIFLRKPMLSGSQNSLKKIKYELEHFQSNGASSLLLVLELDLHFQSQNFWHFIILANIPQMVRDRANIAIAVR